VVATKDSLVYMHDTFLGNLSSLPVQEFINDDSAFVNFLNLQTGKVLLLGLVFFLHPLIQIRQNPMRMFGQVGPMLLMLHLGGDVSSTKWQIL
jgi:hypothetical protein